MTIFLLGHPGLYGGAGTEAHHQIILWRKMGMRVCIIPSMAGYHNEPLYKPMLDLGVEYADGHRDYSKVTPDDVVINFCGKEFFEDLDKIREHTRKTVFVNCMTWLFPNEIRAHEQNKIFLSLYQRPQVRADHKRQLTAKGSKALFRHFRPYFHAENFPFHGDRGHDELVLGRISRQDGDKFSKSTWHIWEYAVSPTPKHGICLGYNHKVVEKTGQPPHWVDRHANQQSLSVQDFYKECDIIVQSSDTIENWPRIGFEAMFSGCPLVVDNRGGWKYMLEHGKSGFLCDNERDFIYWTSRLLYEPELREQIRNNALERAHFLASEESSSKDWGWIFDILDKK